jgi:cytochrome b pre-mRNA-processing protein 3
LFKPKNRPAESLYRAIVTAARQPHFYREWGVPDTVDGRFDMIVLHLFLILDRFRPVPDTADLAQDLTDAFFSDMDRSLREMGVGDLSVGKKIRKMAEACYGRFEAYRRTIEQGGAELADVVRRNVYAGAPDDAGAEALADWMMAARKSLAAQDVTRISAGEITWS